MSQQVATGRVWGLNGLPLLRANIPTGFRCNVCNFLYMKQIMFVSHNGSLNSPKHQQRNKLRGIRTIKLELKKATSLATAGQ